MDIAALILSSFALGLAVGRFLGHRAGQQSVIDISEATLRLQEQMWRDEDLAREAADAARKR